MPLEAFTSTDFLAWQCSLSLFKCLQRNQELAAQRQYAADKEARDYSRRESPAISSYLLECRLLMRMS